MAKKDPAEELRELARKGKIKRPSRTYCEACKKDLGSPLMLLNHMKTVHKA